MLPAPLAIFLALASAPPPAGSLYRIDPSFDVGAVVSSLAVSAAIELGESDLDGVAPCPTTARADGLCDPRTVNPLDRWVTEQGSSLAGHVSDGLVLGLALAPLVVHGLEATGGDVVQPGLRFGEGATVTLESYGAALLLTQVLKYAAARPRPLTYNATFARELRFAKDAHLSFPSGHSALAFSAATALSLALLDHHDASALAWTGTAAAYAAAATVASLRMAAGKHFLTDVLVGAAIGTAITYGVTRAHQRPQSAVGVSSPALVAFGAAW
jgi:membrane-associated phospholipid phosphatase